jgi:hypothetical protein
MDGMADERLSISEETGDVSGRKSSVAYFRVGSGGPLKMRMGARGAWRGSRDFCDREDRDISHNFSNLHGFVGVAGS